MLRSSSSISVTCLSSAADLIPHHSHGLDLGLAAGRVLLLADLAGDLVALGLVVFHIGQHGPAALIQLQDGLHRGRVHLPGDESLADEVGLFTNDVHIQHCAPPGLYLI